LESSDHESCEQSGLYAFDRGLLRGGGRPEEILVSAVDLNEFEAVSVCVACRDGLRFIAVATITCGSIQPNSVIESKGHGIFDPERVVNIAQAEGLGSCPCL